MNSRTALLALLWSASSCNKESAPDVLPRSGPKANAAPVPASSGAATSSSSPPPRPSSAEPVTRRRSCDDPQLCNYVDAFGLSYALPADIEIVLSGDERTRLFAPTPGAIQFIPEQASGYRALREELLTPPRLCLVRISQAPRAECPPALNTSWVVGEFKASRIGVGVARVTEETWDYLRKLRER